MRSKNLLSLPLILMTAGCLYASAAAAIDSPRDLRGTEIRQSVVKWEWTPVSGVKNYQVFVNGRDMGTTRDAVFFSYDLWPGDYAAYVVANGLDGSESIRTATAKIVTSQVVKPGTYVKSVSIDDQPGAPASTLASPPPPQASAPAGLSMVSGLRHSADDANNVSWQWNSVPGASRYEVNVDGNVVGETAGRLWTSPSLWAGEHSLTVKAIDSAGRKSEQSDTLKIMLNGATVAAAKPQNDQAAPPPPQVEIEAPAPPSPLPPSLPQQRQADPNSSKVDSLVDPASFNYSEASNKPGYELVFSDEFNGTALNPYRWHSQFRWDGEWNGERYEYRVINNEDQFYVNVLSEDPEHQEKINTVYNPFTFNGSTMAIKAVRNPLKSQEKKRSHGKLDDIARQQEFMSGAISTHEKFSRKYGYFEARIKIPGVVGAFPAFWLFHSQRVWEGTQRTEIDIMENLGHYPQYIYNSFHYFKNVSETYSGDPNSPKPKPNGQIYTGIDYSQDFHTYAVEWDSNSIVWYIDGVQTSELIGDNESDFEDLYLMINLAVGGNWTNFPKSAGGLGRPNSERFPNWKDINEFQNPVLEVDFVRVYGRK